MATALYRKYRPATFDGVIGQDHIVRTLVNQIEHDRVGHAYLFTGSRGTGKTSCAKIFARAINCERPVKGSPCGECATCKALADASNLDVNEIDAASNNGVDDAREIRERVKYPPVYGKYKVYIIDEVHMLTGSAFNALLKTLEEPPAHAVFILATTEVHKLPATILSRCMRFDFRLVPTDKLAELIGKVYAAEGKQAEPEAVRYIAQAGEGSVRDALSVADMCLNYSDTALTYADCLEVLGATDRGKLYRLFDSIVRADFGECLEAIDDLANLGKSMSLIARDLTQYARDLLVVKTGSTKLVIDTPENIERMRAVAEACSTELLVSIIQIFSALDTELRYSVSPKIVLETACIRAVKLGTTDIGAIEERLARLERGGIVAPTATATPSVATETAATVAPAAAQTPPPIDAATIWGRLTTYMRENATMRLYSLVGKHTDFAVEDGTLVIGASEAEFLEFSDDNTVAAIRRGLSSMGVGLDVKVVRRLGASVMDESISRIKQLMGEAKLEIKK